MKLFIECTNTYLYGGNTGIQRVVRNVVSCSSRNDRVSEYEVIPVAWLGDRFVSVPGVTLRARPGVVAARLLYRLARRLRALVGSRSQNTLPAAQQSANRGAVGRFRRFAEDKVLSRIATPITGSAVEFRKKDVLLLADAWWNMPLVLEAVRENRASGMAVGAVIYDLIPLKHPEYFSESLSEMFATSFEALLEIVDFVVAISNTVADEVREAVRTKRGNLPVHSFRLGHDIGSPSSNERKSNRVPGQFICVGTVEPRKNHHTVLDAFELVWEGGGDCRLTLIGRYGWLADEIASRIQSHPEFNRRLFWERDMRDRALQHEYDKASAVIAASFAEGLGLPVLEGLSRGAPVIASDIPSHREVGGDRCSYFPASDARELANEIRRHMTSPSGSTEVFNWPTWEESTEELISIAMRLSIESRH